MTRSFRSLIADEVRATSMMRPKWPKDAIEYVALLNSKLETLSNENKKLKEQLQKRPSLPYLTRGMIEAACVAHYGDELVSMVGGASGVDLTVAGTNYSFDTALRRMWEGMKTYRKENNHE